MLLLGSLETINHNFRLLAIQSIQLPGLHQLGDPTGSQYLIVSIKRQEIRKSAILVTIISPPNGSSQKVDTLR